MATKQNYIVFYSNQCCYSKEFLSKLYKNVDMYRKFVKVNIDSYQGKIPPYVKNVPTIIVPGQGKNNIYVGDDVFNWLTNLNPNIGNNMGNNIDNKIDGNIIGNRDGIMDYDPAGMGGFSDGFAFIENSEQPMDKTFSLINKQNTSMITPPNDEALDADKLKNEAAGRAMEELKATRDREVTTPRHREG